MTLMEQFLGPETIEEELADGLGALNTRWRAKPPAALRKSLKDVELHWPAGSDLTDRTDELMYRAALENARGTDAATVRDLYHQVALDWAPVIEAMNFAPRVYEEQLGDMPAYARQLKAAFGAKVTKVGRDYFVKYRATPEPMQTEVLEQALVCAAISGDRDLARRMAKAYKIRPVPSEPRDVRYRILRHLLAEDDKAAALAAKGLSAGYAADWPPELVEFPRGVIKHDAALLAAGIRQLNTRMKGRWTIKQWRDRFERITAGKRPRFKGTWDDMMKDVRQFLISMKWLTSPHALAYLNVAAWRGMKSPFDKPKLFSEWIPLALCTPMEIAKSKKKS
jgi:hypothetical protein